MSRAKQTILFFLVLLAAVLTTAALSLAGFGNREILADPGGFSITVSAAGTGLALIVCAAFAGFRMNGIRKRTGEKTAGGDLADSAGFGLLPGIAVWKIFEQYTEAGAGCAVFEPAGGISVLTEGGFFLPCRIELLAAWLCFAGICLWLLSRKRDLSGNGDLILAVLCVWSAVRCVTETLRAAPWIRADSFSLMIPLFCAMNWTGLIIWSVRRGRIQKNRFLDAAEFAGALFCTAAVLLVASGVISTGGAFGDFLIVTISAAVLAVITLSAGMDARKLMSAGSVPAGGVL